MNKANSKKVKSGYSTQVLNGKDVTDMLSGKATYSEIKKRVIKRVLDKTSKGETVTLPDKTVIKPDHKNAQISVFPKGKNTGVTAGLMKTKKGKITGVKVSVTKRF